MRRRALISLNKFRQAVVTLGVSIFLTAGCAVSAHAADLANLAVVKPAATCDQFMQADVKTPDGAKITIKSASIKETEKGSYCVVAGSIEGGYGFQVNLPTEHWTQASSWAGSDKPAAARRR